MINNLKMIREIYGATQEEVAIVADVNRVTISQWESGARKANLAKLEKLSIFFGVGPECFYEIETLSRTQIEMIVETSRKERGLRGFKATHLHETFKNLTFREAQAKYVGALKLVLATTEEASIEDLKTVININEKIKSRLEKMIEIKESEKMEDSLIDLLNYFEFE